MQMANRCSAKMPVWFRGLALQSASDHLHVELPGHQTGGLHSGRDICCLLALGNRGQVKRRVHARTHAPTHPRTHARTRTCAPPPPPAPLPPPLPPPSPSSLTLPPPPPKHNISPTALPSDIFFYLCSLHEQQKASKISRIRNEADNFRSTSVVSASSPNMGGYKHFQLIKKSKIIPCMAIQRPFPMDLRGAASPTAVEWPYRE
jgi:hypothetical protein